jgi:uroporphyrin-III C-methyltransferase
VTDAVPPLPARRSRSALPWIVLIALALLAWRGWALWQGRLLHEQAQADATSQQWRALDARIDALRSDQRAQAQRLQQADATNRVLRDELLGIGQRAALIEDSVRKLAEPERRGVQALRLDEVGLLLGQGEQRLRLAGDLDGARRAYALAAGVLAGIDDPGELDLRQALAQERSALDALGADPAAMALTRLDGFAAMLATSAPAAIPDNATLPWWRRAFAHLVQVRPAQGAVLVDSGDRRAAFAGLQLEITLARSAIERRDTVAYRVATARADTWLLRLWPQTAALRRQRAQLQALRALPLTLQLPTLGSTRQLLQSRRANR